jgi:uncharacterized protein (TIGR03437 family)
MLMGGECHKGAAGKSIQLHCYPWPGLVKILFLVPITATRLAVAQSCGSVQLQLSPDYSFAIGSSTGGTNYSFSLGGQTIAQGAMTQLALLHYDTLLTSTSGTAPAQSVGTSFVTGKFGSAVAVAAGGILSYPVAGNLSLGDGTIEMWVSSQFDGTNSVYTQAPQVLFQYYWGNNGEVMSLGLGSNGSVIAGAGVGVGYGGSSVLVWKAGEWHHLAFTYSSSKNRLRLFVDGAQIGESDNPIHFPTAGPPNFTVASDSFGHASNFSVDELRISGVEMDPAAIAYDASRTGPFANDEVYLSLTGVNPGQLTYSIGGCGVATLPYAGIPITNFSPPSGLLPAGSTGIPISFQTISPTVCRYSVGSNLDYDAMFAFDTGPPTMMHQGSINGIPTDTRVLNSVYIRCASNQDFVQSNTYRTVAAPTGPFPRIGNIWLGGYLYAKVPNQAEKTQLFLGANMSAADAIALRSVNPDVLILPSVQLDDTWDYTLPESYYLHDTNGKRFSDWCSSPPPYVLNMTRPEVAAYVGQQAYQMLAQSNWAFDGMFFDSFGTSKTVSTSDCFGNLIQISSQNNGLPDDQASLNTAWASGEYLAISTYRKLVPGGYVSGHVGEAPAQAASLAAFNGTSIEFYTQSVRDGSEGFGTLWDLYQSWATQSVAPPMTMIQSCPPDQLSYGYGYYPLNTLLPGTVAFAQDSYANMRFGLGLTLMNDGFFMFDFGDTAPPITWWYDEYDFNLGYPIAPAAPVTQQYASLLSNGSFEQGLAGWQLNVFHDGQAHATAADDQTVAADGNASAQITITSAGTANWHITFEQDNLSFSQGAEYRLQFWARADSPRTITVFSQGGAPNYPNYGLAAQIQIDTSWGLYSASFTSPATAKDGRLEFWVGDLAGNVWLDDVQLSLASPSVYRRDYSNGTVLLNGTATQQTVLLEEGFQRFVGSQAPLFQYMVDDSSASFTARGSWKTVSYNTGAYSGAGSSATLPPEPQHANGPYYHCWQGGCHELDSGSGTAQWSLNIPADGQYTIQVWLPAAPNASRWTTAAIYEVVSAGKVIASATIDQTSASAGDGLHMIGAVSLTTAGAPLLRVHNAASGPLIADAVYVMSAALYNDGSPAHQVTLAPFDAILLERQRPVAAPASRVTSVVSAASFQPAIASGGLVSIAGTSFGTSTKSWSHGSFPGPNLPVSINGISVTINGKKAYVEYVSPTEVKVIAPDDDTTGQVSVQVTTHQGASYPGTVLKQRLAPAFFTTQSGTTNYAVATHQDGTLVGPDGPTSRPAKPGELIKIHGTGFGATAPKTAASAVVTHSATLALPVTVTIGGVNAGVHWAGLVASGVYELEVNIPNVKSGDQAVWASMSGFQTPPNVFLPVTAK